MTKWTPRRIASTNSKPKRWMPMREFWTFEGAKKFYKDHSSCAYLYQWLDGVWREVLAPPRRKS